MFRLGLASVRIRRELLIYVVMPAAYVVIGRLGLWLAVPPGYASAIFLPAGIAVTATFMAGVATLPGIFLAAFLLNVWAGYSIAHQLDVINVACGHILQAAVGATVLRRTIGYPAPFDNPRDLFLFLLLSPVFCLTSSSLSLGGLWALGAVQVPELMINWMTWWAGDTLGVVFVLPLMLALAGKPRTLWRSRAFFVSVPMLFSFALFVAIFILASNRENEQSLLEFRMRSQQIADTMKATLDEQALFLEQLSNVFINRRLPVTRQHFHDLVQKLAQHIPTIQAVEWAPRVASAERRAFETAQQADLPGFAIRERDPSGQLRSASDRSQFYAVTYIEPFSGNEEAVGFDIASDADRRAALDAALSSGNVTATPPVHLLQETEKQTGIILVNAVPGGPTGPGTVLVVVRMGTFATTIADPFASTLRLRLVDAAGGRPLFEAFSAPAQAAYETAFNFGTRRYVVQTMPSTVYLAQHRAWESWAVLAAGALGTGLLGALLLLGTGHAYRFERLADKLRESEARLTAILEQIPLGVGLVDRKGRLTAYNSTLKHWVGEAILLSGQVAPASWRAFGKDGHVLPRDEWPSARALRGETVVPGVDFLQTSEDGREKWMRVGAAPFRHETGEVTGALAIVQDIETEKRTEQANLVLIGELQHRTRNLLAVIQSIARQTIRSSKDFSEFEVLFIERLATLSRVQKFLSRPNDQPVTCGELVRGELAALVSNLEKSHITLEGSEIPLPGGSVQILALALHELATNALKHGALSKPEGRLMVKWYLVNSHGLGRHLSLEWLETGIDLGQTGFGSVPRGCGRELIEKALVYQLGAKTRFDLSDSGLRCMIEIPVEVPRPSGGNEDGRT
jgi:two-component sensor histidine kinase/CHASE1-domain containing sensor protein